MLSSSSLPSEEDAAQPILKTRESVVHLVNESKTYAPADPERESVKTLPASVTRTSKVRSTSLNPVVPCRTAAFHCVPDWTVFPGHGQFRGVVAGAEDSVHLHPLRRRPKRLPLDGTYVDMQIVHT